MNAPAIIQPRTLSNQAYEAVKQQIFDHVLRPGQRVVIDQLARELGISPTPIREAMRQLEHEGLIQVLPHRSAMVVRPSRKKLIDLFQVRSALEVQAVRLVARRGLAEGIDDVRQNLAQAEQSIHQQDVARWSGLDDEFHNFFVERCGNETLARMSSQLNNIFALYRRIPMLKRFPEGNWEALSEHQQIVEHIQAGHVKEAGIAARRHIRKSLQYSLQSFQDQQ